jgi:myosin-1
MGQNTKTTYVRVLYDFQAMADNEMTIVKGQIIELVRKEYQGWSLAWCEKRQKQGWLPTAYVVEEREKTTRSVM